MRFFSNRPTMSAIDKVSKKRICLFKDGIFETDDPILIKKLKPHFKNDGTGFKFINYWKLRDMAEDKGLNHHNLKKANLVRLLERSERNE